MERLISKHISVLPYVISFPVLGPICSRLVVSDSARPRMGKEWRMYGMLAL